MITPTNQQNEALDQIKHWFQSDPAPFYYLGGHAGSGKTSLARLAVDKCGLDPDNHRQVCYATYTGKAAMALRRAGLHATTIHQLIYILEERNKDGKLFFKLNPKSELSHARLLVLDECSMVSDKVAGDLLSYNVKILVLGDPGQLEPVNGTGYFTKGTPDFFLSEIHRQALESSIIRLSMDIRAGKSVPYGDYGDVKKISFDDLSDQDLINADQVITGMHRTRYELNMYMLSCEGFQSGYPFLPGIKVLCMKNYHNSGLLNGIIGRTMDVVEPDMINWDNRWFNQTVFIEEGPVQDCQKTHLMRINFGAFQDNWDPRSDYQKMVDQHSIDDSIQPLGWVQRTDSDRIMEWDFGYTITCHKSQGSQWNDLILYDDGMMAWNSISRKRWLYTAVTRAAKTLTIVD